MNASEYLAKSVINVTPVFTDSAAENFRINSAVSNEL